MERSGTTHAPAAVDGVPNGKKPAYPIGSVDNALRLLLMFSTHKLVRIAEASRELGVARSTAHRLMEMLQHYAFVRQDPDSKAYLPGPALMELGLSVVRDLDVRTVARPIVEQLVAELQETVHVVSLKGRDVLFLDSVESPRMLRIGGRTGDSLPAYAAAGGKVLLAELPSAVLHELYPGDAFAPLTGRTNTEWDAFLCELEGIRARGYAVSFGEVEADVSAVAAPIRDRRGSVPAALTVSMPFSRARRQDVPRIAKAAIAAAAAIGEQLDA